MCGKKPDKAFILGTHALQLQLVGIFGFHLEHKSTILGARVGMGKHYNTRAWRVYKGLICSTR